MQTYAQRNTARGGAISSMKQAYEHSIEAV